MDVFELVAKITLDSGEFDKGLGDAEGKASGFASKFGGGLATAAKVGAAGFAAVVGAGSAAVGMFASMTKSTAEYGDNIDKMSQKMGLTAQSYQEWDAVMRHSGTSMETLKTGMKTLANAAETGNKAFEQLGITQEQIASMNQEELFSATISALQNVESDTERTYLAGKLLGRGATELGALLNTSAEDTQRMKDRVHELGGALSDDAVKNAARFQDSLQDMHTAIDGAKNSLASGFLPAISDVMDGIGNVVSGFNIEGGLAQIEQGVDGFIQNMNEVIPRVIELAGRIIPAFASAIATNLPNIAQAGFDIIMQLGQGIANNIPNLIAKLPDIIVGIVNFITNNLPTLIQVGVQIVVGIIQGLAQAIPQLISYAPQILAMIVQGIGASLQILWQNGPAIVQAIGQGVLNAISSLLDLGVYIVQAIAEGILSALGFLGDAIISLFEGGRSAGDTSAAGYRSLGEHAATEAQAGLESGSGGFSAAVQSFLAQGHQSGEGETGSFSSIGTNAATNVTDGWSGSEGSFGSAVAGTMDKSLGLAEGAAATFNVPGAEAVENLASGVQSGIGAVDGAVNSAMSSAQSAGEAAATMFGSVGTSMVTQTTSSIAAAAPAVSSAARGVITTAYTVANSATSMFTSVGQNIARGIAAGISAGSGAIAAAARSAVQAAVAAAKAAAAISSPSKLFRDEVGYFMGLGVAAGLEDAEDETTKAAVKLARDTYSKAKEWIRRTAKMDRWSLQDELNAWIDVQAGFNEGSQQWLDAEETVFDIREKMADEFYKNEEERINKDIKRNKKSLTEQLQMWTDFQNKYEKDSEEWVKIDDKIFDLRLDIAENFEKETEKIWKNIADAQKKYDDKLEDGIEKIAGAYSLFDDVQDREAVSADELTTNLLRQVNVLGSFYSELDQLAARGVSTEMVDEIREMGPKAVDQLEALLSMSDEQLSEYAMLFGEKQRIASETALKELSGFKEETENTIKENVDSLLEIYNENGPTLGEALTTGITDGIKRGMSSVVDAAIDMAENTVDAIKTRLGFGGMKELEKVFTTSKIPFASSGLGISSAGIINNAIQQSQPEQKYTINLQMADGSVMARWIFAPLKDYASAKGQPIVNAT